MSDFTVKFQDADDLPALARFAQRLANTPCAGWPLDPAMYSKLAGAPDHDEFPVRRRRLLLCEKGEVRALQGFFEHEIYLDGKAHACAWPPGPLSEAKRQELRRRLEEHAADPSDVVPWEQIEAEPWEKGT